MIYHIGGWVIDIYRTGTWQRLIDVEIESRNYYFFLYWYIIHVWYKGQ